VSVLGDSTGNAAGSLNCSLLKPAAAADPCARKELSGPSASSRARRASAARPSELPDPCACACASARQRWMRRTRVSVGVVRLSIEFPETGDANHSATDTAVLQRGRLARSSPLLNFLCRSSSRSTHGARELREGRVRDGSLANRTRSKVRRSARPMRPDVPARGPGLRGRNSSLYRKTLGSFCRNWFYCSRLRD